MACIPGTFEGYWFLSQNDTVTPQNMTDSLGDGPFCLFETNCTESSLVSQIQICPEQEFRLSTSNAIINVTISDTTPPVCVLIGLNASSILVFTQPVKKTVGMTFVQVNGDDAKNSFSVVFNEKGYVVGQIMSDVIITERTFPSYVFQSDPISLSATRMDICFECILCRNETLQSEEIDPRFTIMDIGFNISEYSFRPLGWDVWMRYLEGNNEMVCFSGVLINDTSTKLVLVARMDQYESYTLMPKAQKNVLFCSGVLYGVSGLVIVLVQSMYCSLYVTISIMIIGLQSTLMMAIRCVYFILISYDWITAGSLTDFILMEIPTFFYLHILIQILVSVYLFTDILTKKRSQNLTPPAAQKQNQNRFDGWRWIFLCWFVVWLGFVGVILGISLVNKTTTISRTCDCRISVVQQPSNAALYIRIACQSAILLMALCVFVLMGVISGRSLYAKSPSLFYQIVSTSFFLLLNCIAFVIYYSVNEPSPYFVIVLLFTEMLPILVLNVIVAIPGIKYTKTMIRSSIVSWYGGPIN